MKALVLRDDRLTVAHVALAAVMGALGVVATLPAWKDIYLIAWKDEEYSHIFVVPFVAIFLVWVRRMRLRHCKPTGRIIGPMIVALGWILNSWGFYSGIQSFWHGGAVLVVVGCILSVLGKGVIFRFFPAFLLLVFLVPAPGRYRLAIAGPLQNWTASITQRLLEAGGVMNTEVNGNALTINGHAVLVAEACNGLRMVFSLIMVGFAFCFAMPLRNYIRALILLISPLAAIFCNVVRIIPTIWMYGYMPQYAQKFHEYAGWAMLPLAFAMLYGLIRTLQWAVIPVNEYTLASQ
jgi:exosortase